MRAASLQLMGLLVVVGALIFIGILVALAVGALLLGESVEQPAAGGAAMGVLPRTPRRPARPVPVTQPPEPSPEPAPSLRPLGHADLVMRDHGEDIRSRKVVDANGDEVGTIEELLVYGHKVRVLRVASGGFLGLRRDKVLIPVEAIAKITDDVVHIDQTRERIAGAPPYDPELVDDDYFRSLNYYYGY